MVYFRPWVGRWVAFLFGCRWWPRGSCTHEHQVVWEQLFRNFTAFQGQRSRLWSLKNPPQESPKSRAAITHTFPNVCFPPTIRGLDFFRKKFEKIIFGIYSAEESTIITVEETIETVIERIPLSLGAKLLNVSFQGHNNSENNLKESLLQSHKRVSNLILLKNFEYILKNRKEWVEESLNHQRIFINKRKHLFVKLQQISLHRIGWESFHLFLFSCENLEETLKNLDKQPAEN